MRIQHGVLSGSLIGFLVSGAFTLDAHYVGDVLAHSQNAEPSRCINVLELCRLELALVSDSIKNVLGEDERHFHGKGHAVIFHKVCRRFGVENLCVGKSYYPVRILLVGIVCKGLVAGKVDSGFSILCECHAGHVVQKR